MMTSSEQLGVSECRQEMIHVKVEKLNNIDTSDQPSTSTGIRTEINELKCEEKVSYGNSASSIYFVNQLQYKLEKLGYKTEGACSENDEEEEKEIKPKSPISGLGDNVESYFHLQNYRPPEPEFSHLSGNENIKNDNFLDTATNDLNVSWNAENSSQNFSSDESSLLDIKEEDAVNDTDHTFFESKCFEAFIVENEEEVHTAKEGNDCENHERDLSQKVRLNKSLRRQSPIKTYECAECLRQFVQKCHLKRHMKIHIRDYPYQCEECKRFFSEKTNLKMHLRTHTKEKPYECKECKRKFSHSSTLKEHSRIHTKEKPYKCQECKKKFSRHYTLTRHSRIHTGHKPYECQECESRFSHRNTFKRHLRIHTEERPYECQECKQKFSSKNALKQHLTIHTKEYPYECQELIKDFHVEMS